MGFDLGAGLAASSAFFRDQEHLEDRAYARKQQEYDAARMKQGLDMMPVQAEEQRARLGLSTANSNSELGLVQTRAANARAGLDNAAGALKFQSEQQPVLQQMEAASNRARAENQPMQQEIESRKLGMENEVSKQEADQQPAHLHALLVKGKLDEQGVVDLAFNRMGKFISDGNKAGLLDFANGIAKTKGIFPATDGEELIDVQQTATGYKFTTKSGKEIPELPAAALRRSMDSVKTGKYSAVHTPDGTIGTINHDNGDFKVVRPGDPLHARRGTNAHDPSDVATAKWLLTAGVAKNETEAWEKVRSARDQSRPAWIAEMTKTLLMPGAKAEDIQKYEKMFGEQYDRVHAGAPRATTVPNPVAADPAAQARAARARALIGL